MTDHVMPLSRHRTGCALRSHGDNCTCGIDAEQLRDRESERGVSPVATTPDLSLAGQQGEGRTDEELERRLQDALSPYLHGAYCLTPDTGGEDACICGRDEAVAAVRALLLDCARGKSGEVPAASATPEHDSRAASSGERVTEAQRIRDAWGTLDHYKNEAANEQRFDAAADLRGGQFRLEQILTRFTDGSATRSGRVAPSVPGRLPEIVCDDRVGLGELWIVDPVTEGVIGKIENLAREDVRFSAEGEARGQSTPISHSAEADRAVGTSREVRADSAPDPAPEGSRSAGTSPATPSVRRDTLSEQKHSVEPSA